MLTAIVAVAFVSCTKEIDHPEESSAPMKTIKVITDIATKTTLDANHQNIVWSEGDKISIFNDVDNTNEEVTYAAGGDIEVEVPAATTEIYAHYPYYSGNSSGPESASVYIANKQTQDNPGELNGRYFPMVAKGTVSADNKALISLYPVASALALNIYHSGLEGQESVKSVTVTPASTNTGFTGSQVTDLTGDNIKYTVAASSNPITVTLTNALALGSERPTDKQKFAGQIYVCLAKQSYANVTFEIQTNKGTYTISSNATPFDCVNNDFVPVNINLAAATFEAAEELAGTYVILAKKDNKSYAMANTHADNSNRLDEVEFSDGATTTNNRAIVWTIAKNGNNYSITDGAGKYLTASTSNDANVNNSAAYCAILKNTDGTYAVTQTVSETDRYLSRNDSNNGFAFYSNSSQNCALYLVPMTLQAPPMLEWGAESVSIEADDDDSHEITLTATDANSVSVAVFEEDEQTVPSWLVASYENGVVTYMAEANTSDLRRAVIIATATNPYGSVTAKINVTQKADNSYITKGDAWSYTFANTDFAQANTAYNREYNGLTLTFKSTLSKAGFDSSNNRGVQFGAGKGEFTITVSGYEAGIESIKLVMSSNASGNTISATVGGKAIGSQVTLSNENNYVVEFSDELMAGGDIVFSINDKSKSVYLKSITINPEAPAPATVTGISVEDYTSSFTASESSSYSFDGKVYAVYSDDSKEELSADEFTVTGTVDLTAAGTYNLTIAATIDGASYSKVIEITVNSASGSNTSTLTFTAACGGSGTANDGVSWTVDSDGNESSFDSTKGIHYGTNSAAVQYIRLSTSGISGTITKVVVNASTASGVSATVGVTVNGNPFGGDAQSLSSTATNYTFEGSASGEIIVTVTKPSSATKALYVKSVEVTYTPTN